MPEPHGVRVNFIMSGTSRDAGAEGDALGHVVSLTQEDTVAVLCPRSVHTEDGMKDFSPSILQYNFTPPPPP